MSCYCEGRQVLPCVLVRPRILCGNRPPTTRMVEPNEEQAHQVVPAAPALSTYRRGAENSNADGLSRANSSSVVEMTEETPTIPLLLS